MDIQKVYDTLEWSALKNIMREFLQEIHLMDMMCVQSISYRYNINGCIGELLKARHGARKGDPIPIAFRVNNGISH